MSLVSAAIYTRGAFGILVAYSFLKLTIRLLVYCSCNAAMSTDLFVRKIPRNGFNFSKVCVFNIAKLFSTPFSI